MAYTITGEKCGAVRLDAATTGVVVTESIQRSSKVTANPIESGANINDHVVSDPVRFTITGTLIDGDSQMEILDQMCKEHDIVEYTGQSRISDCVITSCKLDFSAKNKTGASFTIQLQVINITASEYVETGERIMMSAQDADAPTAPSVSKSQTAKPKAEGRKTTSTHTVSSNAYLAYVNSYNKKAASSSGPMARKTAAFSAA